MYLSELTPAMKPSDAFAYIARRKTDRVSIDELEGRVTVGLVTPYPPGIPLLIPGEVFNKKIVDYLIFAREFSKLCPGFETDIHGLVELTDENGDVQFYADCVARDDEKLALQTQVVAAPVAAVKPAGGLIAGKAPAATSKSRSTAALKKSLKAEKPMGEPGEGKLSPVAETPEAPSPKVARKTTKAKKA